MIKVTINGDWLEVRHIDAENKTMVIRSVRL